MFALCAEHIVNAVHGSGGETYSMGLSFFRAYESHIRRKNLSPYYIERPPRFPPVGWVVFRWRVGSFRLQAVINYQTPHS